MDPKQLRYAPTHEWARLENDICTVGITQFAAEQLGDITIIEFKKPGTRIEAKQSCGEIESVKSVNDIYAPVSGEIVETNDQFLNKALNDDSKALATDPYGAFWMVKFRVAPGTTLDHLLTPEQYEQQIASEGH